MQKYADIFSYLEFTFFSVQNINFRIEFGAVLNCDMDMIQGANRSIHMLRFKAVHNLILEWPVAMVFATFNIQLISIVWKFNSQGYNRKITSCQQSLLFHDFRMK